MDAARTAGRRGYALCRLCGCALTPAAHGAWFSSLTPAEQDLYTHSLTLPPDAPRPPGTPIAPRDRVLAAIAAAKAKHRVENGGAS